jgi:hypothetical protein
MQLATASASGEQASQTRNPWTNSALLSSELFYEYDLY